MGISHASVGRLLTRLGRHGEAVAELDKSLAVRRRLVADDANNAFLKVELAEAHAFRGESLRALGREDAACRAFAESAAVYRAITATGPLPAGHEAEPARVAGLLAPCTR
jgi:hypothetical protein